MKERSVARLHGLPVRAYRIHSWKRRGWLTADKKPVERRLWKTLDEVAKGHEVEWHWVKGHAGHPENERADALANRGIEVGV